MRFVEADHQEKWLVASGRQLPRRLGREERSGHVGVCSTIGTAEAIEPNARRIAERLPGWQDIDSCGEWLRLSRRQRPVVIWHVNQPVETMFQRTIEVHLANGRRAVAGAVQDFGERRLAFRERCLKQRHTDAVRIATGKE